MIEKQYEDEDCEVSSEQGSTEESSLLHDQQRELSQHLPMFQSLIWPLSPAVQVHITTKYFG